jgi:transcriptional regulator with XRE-family HTH domain
VYTAEQRSAALRLIGTNLSDREIARRTGVSRGTVRNWRLGKRHMAERYAHREITITRPLYDPGYSYLLGLYLGDGFIAVVRRRTVFIRWTLDRRYRGIVRECRHAVALATGARASLYDVPHREVANVQCGGRFWLDLFPQHGPGRKHERKIELVDWQLEITHEFTREFLRGLIHSDGSRCINRFSTKLPSGRTGRYEYPRYFFTNYSEDIRRIFCDHCELLGIRWTRSSWKNISVSHRDSLALLDEFVGPKS